MKKVFLQLEIEALNNIRKKRVKAAVAGAGTVGLPLAVFLARNNFSVAAYDINQERVAAINNGKAVFEYAKFLQEAVSRGFLRATTDPAEAFSGADFIIICVPTPINLHKELDFSFLKSVAEKIKSFMPQGAVVVLESSVSVGATRQMKNWLEDGTDFQAGKNFGLAYCPERYNPGLPIEKHPHIVSGFISSEVNFSDPLTFENVGRVLGAYDEKSLKLSEALYSEILKAPVHKVSSLETAEAAKLMENIFRDVNIGLVNELAIIYSKLGVDIFEVVRAAASKPFAFLPHWPGCGVGGECIPVDTWYLIKQAEAVGLTPHLLKAARNINDEMPRYTVSLLEDAASEAGFNLKGSRIVILGLAYKENTVDDRLSPAYDIKRHLEEKNAEVLICDPVIEHHGKVKTPLVSLPECFRGVDAAILATSHQPFSVIDFAAVKKIMKHPVIIDGRRFFDPSKLKNLGYIYRTIGYI